MNINRKKLGKTGTRQVAPVIKYKTTFCNTILNVMRKRPGWIDAREEEEKKMDFLWMDTLWMHERFETIYFDEHVRVNHFPRFYELTRKNMLAKNLKRFKKAMKNKNDLGQRDLDFFPTTYELPNEWHMFVEEFKVNRNAVNTKHKPIWIMKPIAKSQGKGIFLFKDLKDVQDWKRDGKEKRDADKEIEMYIVQRYIERPLLIGGKKFDMRVYVLVTSFVPLTAWVYREGFVRFSNTRFTTDHIEDSFVHLTNVAVQKTAPDYDPDRGAKWPLKNLRRYLSDSRSPEETRQAFQRINSVFLMSLQAVQDKVINDKHSFELYGYDVLFDESLKVWLLEVNSSPSLSASSKEDKVLKEKMLDDTLNVLDMEHRLTGHEKRVGGYDILNETSECFLGCDNSDRESHLRKTYREASYTVIETLH